MEGLSGFRALDNPFDGLSGGGLGAASAKVAEARLLDSLSAQHSQRSGRPTGRSAGGSFSPSLPSPQFGASLGGSLGGPGNGGVGSFGSLGGGGVFNFGGSFGFPSTSGGASGNLHQPEFSPAACSNGLGGGQLEQRSGACLGAHAISPLAPAPGGNHEVPPAAALAPDPFPTSYQAAAAARQREAADAEMRFAAAERRRSASPLRGATRSTSPERMLQALHPYEDLVRHGGTVGKFVLGLRTPTSSPSRFRTLSPMSQQSVASRSPTPDFRGKNSAVLESSSRLASTVTASFRLKKNTETVSPRSPQQQRSLSRRGGERSSAASQTSKTSRSRNGSSHGAGGKLNWFPDFVPPLHGHVSKQDTHRNFEKQLRQSAAVPRPIPIRSKAASSSRARSLSKRQRKPSPEPVSGAPRSLSPSRAPSPPRSRAAASPQRRQKAVAAAGDVAAVSRPALLPGASLSQASGIGGQANSAQQQAASSGTAFSFTSFNFYQQQ